jgi:hypothetical protein
MASSQTLQFLSNNLPTVYFESINFLLIPVVFFCIYIFLLKCFPFPRVAFLNNFHPLICLFDTLFCVSVPLNFCLLYGYIKSSENVDVELFAIYLLYFGWKYSKTPRILCHHIVQGASELLDDRVRVPFNKLPTHVWIVPNMHRITLIWTVFDKLFAEVTTKYLNQFYAQRNLFICS